MKQASGEKCINLKLKVWRQKAEESNGRLESFKAENISKDMSFLEMLDVVNEEIILSGKDPILIMIAGKVFVDRAVQW